jgi:predicted ABC-type ATPase
LGGHDVPADVVKRRFGRSLSNFFTLYASPESPLADEWTLFDNTDTHQIVTIAELLNNELNILEPKTWQKLQKLSKTT